MNDQKRATILLNAGLFSYGFIAKKLGLTRSQAAGVVWRSKNPYGGLILITTKGKRCGGRYGRGWNGPGKNADVTLRNAR